MLAGLWHFSFTVGDLERSLAFYRDALGLDVIHTQEQDNEYTRRLVGYPDAILRVAMLRIPGAPVGPSGHHLELVEYVTPRGTPADVATKNPGAAHLAFIVRDIQAAYRQLKGAGVVFRSEPVAITQGRHRGGYTVYFLDPDGITLELHQPPPHFWEGGAS
ncbi:MAG TPA: VOC family protein [bacterium]|nr:VOC family protein [bacterium]